MRKNQRRALSLALAFVAGTSALVVAPLRVAAASTVTLTASKTTTAAGTSVTFTATATPTPAPEYNIEIDELTRSDFVGQCFDQNPCTAPATYPTTFSGTFQATLTDNAGVQTKSNTVVVAWTGTAAYTLTLTADTNPAVSGTTVTLTATASPGVPTGYFIDIYETGTQNNVADCYEQNGCQGFVSNPTGTHSYTAFLDNDPNFEDPPKGTIATAGPLQVTWMPASQFFCSPATVPANASVDGVNLILNTKVGLSETDVCLRVDNGGSIAVGGALVIKSGALTSLPTVTASDLCTGAFGNLLPTTHPIVSTSVDGVTTTLDAYFGPASNGDIWVCATLGSLNETVIIPSPVAALPSVNFVPDPDSIVQ